MSAAGFRIGIVHGISSAPSRYPVGGQQPHPPSTFSALIAVELIGGLAEQRLFLKSVLFTLVLCRLQRSSGSVGWFSSSAGWIRTLHSSVGPPEVLGRILACEMKTWPNV